MLPGCLVLTFFSSGGEKCSWCPLLPLPKQVVTTDNQSHHRGAFPTSSTPGHQGGVRHHADTGGRTVRQQHHPEVTHSLSYHCGLLNLTAITMTVCCLFLSLCLLQCPKGKQESQHEEREQGLLLQGTDHWTGVTGGKVPFTPLVYLLMVLMSTSHFDFSSVLQELKRKKGIKEEVQLTSKQKEMMQNQLEKEAAIRKRLQGVWNNVITVTIK